MSMLIDRNIKYDIYASLYVVKYCVFAVKMGKSRTLCIVLDCITVLIFVVLREAPPTVSGGPVLPIWAGGWWGRVTADLAHLEPQKMPHLHLSPVCELASILLCLEGFIDSCFYSCGLLDLRRSEPPLGRARPFSDIHQGHTDTHSLVCQQLTR